jgi:hypothetical protein
MSTLERDLELMVERDWAGRTTAPRVRGLARTRSFASRPSQPINRRAGTGSEESPEKRVEEWLDLSIELLRLLGVGSDGETVAVVFYPS